MVVVGVLILDLNKNLTHHSGSLSELKAELSTHDHGFKDSPVIRTDSSGFAVIEVNSHVALRTASAANHLNLVGSLVTKISSLAITVYRKAFGFKNKFHYDKWPMFLAITVGKKYIKSTVLGRVDKYVNTQLDFPFYGSTIFSYVSCDRQSLFSVIS